MNKRVLQMHEANMQKKQKLQNQHYNDNRSIVDRMTGDPS